MIDNRISDLLKGEWLIASKLNNNKVVNINIGSSDPTNVTIWDKANVDQQKWTIQCDSSDRCFIIRSKKYPNKVLSRTSTIQTNGENVFVADYYDGFPSGEQRWYLHYDCSGYYVIANFIGDYLNPDVLELNNSDTTNGSNILVKTNSGADKQKFYLIRP